MTMMTVTPLVLGSLGSAALGWLMFTLSVFLILLILVQRGKGGGLTGALGGPGGQSAFGSKAGDTFTVITAVSAIIWGLVCAIAMYSLGVPPLTADDEDYQLDDTPVLTSPADELGDSAGAGGLSGLSGLLPDEPQGDAAAEGEGGSGAESEPETTSGTPSADLTPAEPSSDESGDPATEPSDDADSPAPTSE